MTKIMLVEDDNNLREIYEARLAAEGYEIVSAADGEAALALAGKEHPEMIISDVMMPKISGFEMLDILRNTDSLRNVKIIMLTALGQAEDSQRANALGADRYLVKSQVTLEDIVKATHELLDDPRDAEPDLNTVVPTDISEVSAIAMPDAEEGTAESDSAGPKVSEDSEANATDSEQPDQTEQTKVAEEVTAEPITEPVEEPAQEPAEEPSEAPVAEPEVAEPTEAPSEEVTEAPAEDSVSTEPVTEPAIEPASEPEDTVSQESVDEALAAEPDAPAPEPLSITIQEPTEEPEESVPSVESAEPADGASLKLPEPVTPSVSLPVADDASDDTTDDSSIPVASEPDQDEVQAEEPTEELVEEALAAEPAAEPETDVEPEQSSDEAAAALRNDPLAVHPTDTDNLHPISGLPVSHIPPEDDVDAVEPTATDETATDDSHFEVPVISLDGGVSNVDAASVLDSDKEEEPEEPQEPAIDYTSPENFNNFQVPLPGSENTENAISPTILPSSGTVPPQSAADEEAAIRSKIDEFVTETANANPPEEVPNNEELPVATGAIVVSGEPLAPDAASSARVEEAKESEEELVAEEPATVAPTEPAESVEPVKEHSDDEPTSLAAETLDEKNDDRKVYDSGVAASSVTEIMVPQDTLEPNESRLPVITGPGIDGAPENNETPEGMSQDTSTDNDDDLVAAAAAELAAKAPAESSDDDDEARKSVTPIGGNKPKPDLHQLLALEDAKNAAHQAVSDVPKPNVDAYKPSGQQAPESSDKPTDPGHISL